MDACEVCRATGELEFDSEGRRVCAACALADVQSVQRGRAARGRAPGCVGPVVLLGLVAIPLLLLGLFAWGAFENARAGVEMLGAETTTGRVVALEHRPARRRQPAEYRWTVEMARGTCTVSTFTDAHRLGDRISIDVLERDGALRCEESGSHGSLWLAGFLASPVVLVVIAIGGFVWLRRRRRTQ